jgi:hypothetical protein
MNWGTSHFVSADAALAYYRAQNLDAIDIARKLKDGEIAIGEPPLQAGETLFLNKREGRYFIQDGKP